MKLTNTINQEIKQAMLARDKERLEALRAVKTAFTLSRTEKGADAELTDDEEIKIVQKLVKQRKDSAEIYQEQNRVDLAEKELKEHDIIIEFMPAQMEETEVKTYLETLISEMGVTSMQQMGQVMGRATKELAGKADGKVISTLVRSLLS